MIVTKPPKLDDRTFDALVEEAKRRIPRYTQESWTDYNESDPGIALIELFAWLTETMLWEINRVPERGYESLLRLLDIRRMPAVPALVDVTFSINKDIARGLETIPMFTQLGAESEDGSMIFETDRPLDPVRHSIQDVRVYDSDSQTWSTEVNRINGSSFAPFGKRGSAGSVLYLGFGDGKSDEPIGPSSSGNVANLAPFPQQITFWVTKTSDNPTNPGNTYQAGGIEAAPPVQLIWEYKASVDSAEWIPLRTFDDTTLALTREGYLTIEGPQAILPAPLVDGDKVHRYWIRCRIPDGASYPAGRPPKLNAILVNTVPARHMATIHRELLAVSEAMPGLEFQLRHTPLQPDSLVIETVSTTGETETWSLVDTLLAAGPEELVFMIDPATGKGRFGDDIHGRIPERGVQIFAERYRYGGGLQGNVKPGSISGLLKSFPGVQGVTNLRRAVGGADTETAEQIKQRAPMALRNQNRAVTVDDYVSQVTSVGGVKAATVMELFNPNFPDAEAPGALTLLIFPDVYYGTANQPEDAPVPSESLLTHVASALEPRRMLTAEVFVARPQFLTIKVSAHVSAIPTRGAGEIEKECIAALNRFLIPPLADPPGPVTFGRDIYPSSLGSVLEQVDGVLNVRLVSIEINGVGETDMTKAILIRAGEVAWGTSEHSISVEPHRDEDWA